MQQIGSWSIYPVVMADSTQEIKDHAMIWFEDHEVAKRYAEAETSHVDIRHEVYLAPHPENQSFIEFLPGIMVKNVDGAKQTLGRLLYLTRILSNLEN